MIDLSPTACDQRLTRELTFVTRLGDRVWNQEVWGITFIDRAHFYPSEQEPCETHACLVGWAAIHEALAQPSIDALPGYLDNPYEEPTYCLEITQTGQELISRAGFKHLEGYYDISQDFFALGAVIFGLGTRERAYLLLRANHTLGSLWSTAALLTEGRVRLPATLVNRVIQVDSARYERSRR